MPVDWWKYMNERGPWIMEVLTTVDGDRTRMEWRAVHTTGCPIPYRFQTKGAAVSAVQTCYPDEIMGETVRIRRADNV